MRQAADPWCAVSRCRPERVSSPRELEDATAMQHQALFGLRNLSQLGQLVGASDVEDGPGRETGGLGGGHLESV